MEEEFERVSSQQFVKAVSEGEAFIPIIYEYPGLFRYGGMETQIPMQSGAIAEFLLKLQKILTFGDYDELTRRVYVSHMKNAPDRNPLDTRHKIKQIELDLDPF